VSLVRGPDDHHDLPTTPRTRASASDEQPTAERIRAWASTGCEQGYIPEDECG